MNHIIITHRGCRDGFAASWCAHIYFNSINIDTVTYLYVDPNKPDETVELVKKSQKNNIATRIRSFDVAFDPLTFLKIKELCDDFKIYDHHISGYNDFIAYYGVDRLPKEFNFNNNKSGAVLAWEYFFPELNVPRLIKYVEDRDLWRFELPDSRAISEGLPLGNKFEDWDNFMENETKNLNIAARTGNMWLRKKKKTIAFTSNLGKVVQLNDHNVFIINCPNFISDVGEYIYTKHDTTGKPLCDYVMMWRYSMNDKDFYVSLRSSNKRDIDVSIIAKKYGGGGHKHAAGFTTKDFFGQVLAKCSN